MIHIIKSKLEAHLITRYGTNLKVEEPKDRTLGDLAIPLFNIAKEMNIKLPTLFEEMKHFITTSYQNQYFEEMEFNKGYLNIKVNKENIVEKIINHINENMDKDIIKINKTVVIDYSSPNIAKSFSIGHLRSTIIGNAIANIYEKLGYTVIRINHLGDWGTQFGKMIVAYQKWGNEDEVKKDPINQLSKLYTRFHDEANENSFLEEEARKAFLSLEQGKEPYVSLWKWFRKVSLDEFMEMYHLLGVSFDSYDGEAFYNDKLSSVINLLEQSNLLKFDDGAWIVDLSSEDLPPALIKKSDGSSLYITRDIAAVLYRKNTYHFDEAIYVVGNEQTLHFKQLKEVVKKLGHDEEALKHVNFGLVLQNGKKMSTRKGKVVKLYHVLEEAVNQAKTTLLSKKSHLEHLDMIAKSIGVSAVIFNDLKNDRTKDIEFNLENMLNFDGMTGPYIQYTRVRIQSILSKHGKTNCPFSSNTIPIDIYYDLIYLLGQYQEQLQKSMLQLEPSIIARYVYHISKELNKIYASDKIIVDNQSEMDSKLNILQCTRYIIDECMNILGMDVLDVM